MTKPRGDGTNARVGIYMGSASDAAAIGHHDGERGHVFTDRLFHARGLSETLLLGAATMRDAIRDHRPHRNLSLRPCLRRQRQRFFHPLRCIHDSKMVHPARLELATF